MNKYNFKKIIKYFDKIVFLITKKPFIVLVFIILLSLFFSLLIFYLYFYLPLQKDFDFHYSSFEDKNYYLDVKNIWDKDEINLKSKDYYNIFIPARITEDELIDDNQEQGQEQEEVQKEEISIEDFTIDVELSEENLESLLIKTLFEFYQTKEDTMPLISERALIWEDLGLGSADDYRGDYNQNIKLLEVLKEKMSN